MIRKLFCSILRRPVVAAIPAGCFLAFIGGALVTEFRLFPYPQLLENPFAYVHASQERQAMEAEAKAEGDQAAVSANGRVTVPATSDSSDGYTFLTFDTGRPSTARLLDQQGNVLHEWHRSYRDIWPDPPHHPSPSPESAIAWRYATLFPNGDILTTIISHGETPYGYGLVKLDKNSNVIWAAADNFHHQFSISDSGHIFCLAHQWRDTKQRRVPGAKQWPKRVLEDFVIELSPEGKELSRVSLLDAMAAPGFRELLGSSFAGDYRSKGWDRTHANDVEFIDSAFASHYPFMKAGMVLLSLRELDALVLLDMKTRRLVWERRGPWVRQHDPNLLDNGNLLLFDNRGDTARGVGSRVLELDLGTGQVAWSYTGSPQHPFRSDKCGGAQRLSNGNTLISEDDNGRVFEVKRDGQIVWEYRDVRVHNASRVARNWLQFVPSGASHDTAAAPVVQSPDQASGHDSGL